MHNSILINRLNEARVERTIDPKLWASVSSGCSKTYKNDLGASARPIGTRDQLLQRFVAGLIILKQQCPITENDMKKCPAFNQWATKLIEMGVTMPEVHKLWNENCGKLPKVVTTIAVHDDIEDDYITPDVVEVEPDNVPANNIVDDNADDEFTAGVMIDDEDENEDEYITPDVVEVDNRPVPAYNHEMDNQFDEVEPLDADVVNDEPVADTTEEPIIKSTPKFDKPTGVSAPYYEDSAKLMNSVHKLLFGKNSQFENLHGCQLPTDVMKFFPKFNPAQEGINNCANLDDFMKLAAQGSVYALRVFRGGDPEKVQGDCVWCEANTATSYYIAVTPSKVGIYFKDENGDFTLAYTGNHADFGFV